MTTALCDNCGGEDMEIVDGLYFCIACGIQSQGVETEMEVGANLSCIVSSQVNDKSEKEELRSLFFRRLNAVDNTLIAQQNQLTELGFSAAVGANAMLIWEKIKAAAVDEYNATNEAPNVDNDIEKLPKASDMSLTKSKNKSRVERNTDLSCSTMAQRSEVTIMVWWLALCKAGYKLLLSDFCRLAKYGYVSCYNLLKCEKLSTEKSAEFRICSLDALTNLYWRTMKLTKFLNLVDRPLKFDVEEIVGRLAFDLNLPGEIFTMAVKVLRRKGVQNDIDPSDDGNIERYRLTMPVPIDLVAMASILIALKCLYSLNDMEEYRLAKEAFEEFSTSPKGQQHSNTPFLFPFWLLHNKMKMAIVTGESAEVVLSSGWFDVNDKTLVNLMCHTFNVDYFHTLMAKCRDSGLEDLFAVNKQSVVSARQFWLKTLPKSLKSLIDEKQERLDPNSMTLFLADFARCTVCEKIELPDMPKYYDFYSLLRKKQTETSFRVIRMEEFSKSFDSLLRICSQYVQDSPMRLFYAVQNIETDIFERKMYRRHNAAED